MRQWWGRWRCCILALVLIALVFPFSLANFNIFLCLFVHALGVGVGVIVGLWRLVVLQNCRVGKCESQLSQMVSIIEEAPLWAMVWDRCLQLRYINKSLAIAIGAQAEGIVLFKSEDIFSRDFIESVKPDLLAVLSTGHPRIGIECLWCFEDEKKPVFGNIFPLRDPRGGVTGAIMTIPDLTEQCRAEILTEEIRKLQTTADLVFKYEEAQRIASLGTWETDCITGAHTWSPVMKEIFGLPEVPPTPELFAQMIHPDDRMMVTRCYQRLNDYGEPFYLQGRLMRPDGHLITVIATGQGVRGYDGIITRLWGTIQDITWQIDVERKRQEAITQANAVQEQLEVEKEVLRIVQHAMLPASVPPIQDVELAVEYQSVSSRMEIGGDWYDAFSLPDGRIGVAVGDVAGHDLRAAIVMGQVRNALRAYAMEHCQPGNVLQRLNNLLIFSSDIGLVTAIYGIYDPVSHTLVFSRAGHQPPLVKTPEGTTELLEPHGTVLGALYADHPYAEKTIDLPQGNSIILYTDGLVERRGCDTSTAVSRLISHVDKIPESASASTIVTSVMSEITDINLAEDDVCLLVLCRPTPAT